VSVGRTEAAQILRQAASMARRDDTKGPQSAKNSDAIVGVFAFTPPLATRIMASAA
jgi:hypothetical protein